MYFENLGKGRYSSIKNLSLLTQFLDTSIQASLTKSVWKSRFYQFTQAKTLQGQISWNVHITQLLVSDIV